MLVPLILTAAISVAAALPATKAAALPATKPTPTPTPAPNGIRQCARSPCPEYTLLEDYGDGFFKRRVEPGAWVYKVAPTCNITSATMSVYMDLHYYFRDNGIKRTTPIVLTVNEKKQRSVFCPEESDHLWCCSQGFSLQFYIPSESQATAPPPSNKSDIHLIRATEPREFYGRALIGGRPTLAALKQHYRELVTFLEERTFWFSRDAYSILSYDAPWRPRPHRFEILVPTEDGDHGHGNWHGHGHGHKHGHKHGHGHGHGHGHHGHHDDEDHGHRRRREIDDLLEVDLIPV
ncbi:uncharacterized protein [Diadema antillarum]|uniref:uncharacterized protein n=1 Tax=Diadema antillarum TaxID=105358 RepID=UPI003A8668FF